MLVFIGSGIFSARYIQDIKSVFVCMCQSIRVANKTAGTAGAMMQQLIKTYDEEFCYSHDKLY